MSISYFRNIKYFLLWVLLCTTYNVFSQSSSTDYFNKGIEYYNEGNYSEALRFFETARTKAVTEYGKSSAIYGQVANACALMHNSLDHYVEAETMFVEAKQAYLTAYGKYSKDYAGVCNNLGTFYDNRYKFVLAEQHLQEALEVYKYLEGRLSLNYSMVLDNLGRVLLNKGNARSALSYFLDSQSILKDLNLNNTIDYCYNCRNIAQAYYAQERYQQSEVMYREALTILTTLYPQDHPKKIGITNELATVYEAQSNYDQAKVLLKESKRLSLLFYDLNSFVYANWCDLMASVYTNEMHYTQADSLYLQAMSIYKSLESENSMNYKNAETNRGIVLSKMGKNSEAISYFEKYKKYLEEKDLTTSKDYSTINALLGNIYLKEKRYQEAERYLMQGLTYYSDSYSKTSSNYVEIVSYLAKVYTETSNFSKANFYYKEMYSQLVLFTKNNFNFLTDKEKNIFFSGNNKYFNQFYSYVLTHNELNHTMNGDFYNLVLNIKGLNYYAGLETIKGSNSTHLTNIKTDFQAYKKSASQLNQLMIQPNYNVSQLEEAKIRTVEMERKLYTTSTYKMLRKDPEVYDWKKVQSKLTEHEAVVEILRFSKETSTVPKDIYVAVVLTKNATEPMLIEIGDAKFLEEKALIYYRNSIKYKKIDTKSYHTFWSKIDSSLAGKNIQKIFYSMDGIYNSINVNTLYNPTSQAYLMTTYTIQNIITGRDLFDTYNTTSTIQSIVLFGYPTYALTNTNNDLNKERSVLLTQDTTQRYLSRGGSITMLPGTKIEVESIYSMSTNQQIQSTLYTELIATEANLKKISNPSILHIATHGYYLKSLANYSSQERVMNFKCIDLDYLPMNKSGLLLAHSEPAVFNSSNNETEDGILTAQEAMFLDLYKTELVILSACETGLGEIVNGEGVYGLQRAFLQTGAKRVIMSLWTVSDEATQLLMTTFYENLLIQKKSIRESFDLAQKTLMQKYPEPYYWGAFVLLGQP